MDKEWYKKIKKADNYMGYVGPKHLYDIMGIIQSILLTQLGMTENSTILDIGCGCFRAGKFIMPICKQYYGVEPETWLWEDKIKDYLEYNPIVRKSIDEIKDIEFDYILMHSILSHMPINMFKTYLKKFKKLSNENTTIIVTYVEGKNYLGSEWVYPSHVSYKFDFIEKICRQALYKTIQIDWPHTSQKWFLLRNIKC